MEEARELEGDTGGSHKVHTKGCFVLLARSLFNWFTQKQGTLATVTKPFVIGGVSE